MIQPMREDYREGGPAEEEGEDSGFRIQAKFFFRKLMRPLVDESWEVTSESSFSSGSIFFASCFPSSTLWTGRWTEVSPDNLTLSDLSQMCDVQHCTTSSTVQVCVHLRKLQLLSKTPTLFYFL